MGLVDDALRAYAKFEDRTTNPATPAAGEGLVFFKDGKLHTIDDAGAVVEYGAGGGGGAVELISEVVLASAAADVDFTSIPGTYRHLKVVWAARGVRAASRVGLSLQFNGDTGSNYGYNTREFVADGTTAALHGDAVTFMQFSLVAGASSPTSALGTGVLTIPHYTQTDFHKACSAEGAMRATTGTGGPRMVVGGGDWRSTAAITRVRLFDPGAGNLAAGSRVALYGHN